MSGLGTAACDECRQIQSDRKEVVCRLSAFTQCRIIDSISIRTHQQAATQAHDGQTADTLFVHLGPRAILPADKAYDADRIRELIQGQCATPNVPLKRNWRWKRCFRRQTAWRSCGRQA
jgi:transposase